MKIEFHLEQRAVAIETPEEQAAFEHSFQLLAERTLAAIRQKNAAPDPQEDHAPAQQAAHQAA